VILSHEVLEHVSDDRRCVQEMLRAAAGRPAGAFRPKSGYPFETHGIFCAGATAGNIPLVNYLPRGWRDQLAPHVRVYTHNDLQRLFAGLPVRYIQQTVIFGAYDNIIARWPAAGRALRKTLQGLEKTPARVLGLSHFWVVEKSE
jgi:hypothetical protein